MRNLNLILYFILFALLGQGCHSDPGIASYEEEYEEEEPSDWLFRQRAYPDGINHKVYTRSVRQHQQAMAQLLARSPQNAGWNFEGPMNVGGRITALDVHPDFPDTIWVGAASGGVFRSYDRGDTFEAVFDDQISLSVGDLDIAPSDPSIIYVGTGEANAGGGSIAYDGVGMYKSTDGGASFEPIGLEQSGSIGRLEVHPQDPNRVYVAAMGRLYADNPERGVYRTDDGGATWEQVLYLNDSTGAIDLVLHPHNPDTIYAATWERVRTPGYYRYGGNSSGIYRSYDGGDTWEHLTNGLPGGATGRIGLALSPANPQIIYAQLIDTVGYLEAVYRSDDGGDSWYNAGISGVNGVDFMWWFGRLFPHPHLPETVFLPSLRLYRTDNGGGSWANITGTSVHVDQHDLYIDPNNPDYMVLGNDGGLYISEDDGETWTHKPTLPITQFYTCEVANLNPDRRFGGTQDNGTIRTTTAGLDDWGLIWSGDGFRCLVDPTNNNFVYLESQRGRLRRSVAGGIPSFAALNGIMSGDRRNWSTPVALNPLNPNSLYYGTYRLYKSTNRAVFWNILSDNLTGSDEPGNLVYGTLTDIAVSPVDTNIIFVGTDNGFVQKSTDGGLTFEDVSGSLPDRWVTRVAASPVDSLTAYVTFSGYRFDDYLPHVFKTEDGGQTWQDVSFGLPEVPVNEIIIDPENPEHLYLGNDVGVYISYNGGLTWQPLGFGLPPVVIGDLCLHQPTRTLYAGTYGRSMYSINLEDLPQTAGTISGAIRTAFGDATDATVSIDEIGLNLDADNGTYAISGLPFGQNFTLSFSKDGDDINGVSTLDLILISQHILGISPLDNPYLRIAADANNSQSITTLDLIQLQKLILNLDVELPDQDSWRLIPANHTFINPENPWAEPLPEVLMVDDLPAQAVQLPDMIAVKIGDINGSALP
jgi:photosystem II stability/assembly factor-like uncharacterized protein